MAYCVFPDKKLLSVLRAQALCTTAAVLGGKSLASQISEKMVGTKLIHFSYSCKMSNI